MILTPELENKLIEKFPVLFGDFDKSPQETCMCWGVDFNDGWYDLFYELLVKLSGFPIIIVLDQVKEKYGGMRVYYHIEGDYDFDSDYILDLHSKVLDLVYEYEIKSYKICEICGEDGRPRRSGWIRTLCDRCSDAIHLS